ncbi:hypothetical protein EJ05DRAFT_243018 [Pseudovirgaria hyperparasitica]|uniref:Rhodopsin domain-containing protein n=1 Tax=Pseudovirgaria hyperparasitica TaxID=470096 RepID=A0A6A6WFV2_9PEZI|nr:uncharacterized protein EJ05DRAFT_243018 [Pseudovirgaria hyperparasitica]KAF2760796.1 hypothetical protein EJ05DRAFT_243018 [Pseudovirgaria hyperparasitica]
MSKTYTPEFLAQNSGEDLIACATIFIILNTTFVGLRFYARFTKQTSLGLDDYVIAFAWVANIGLCVLAITMVPIAGVGRHAAYIHKAHPEKIMSWAKSIYALEWLYLPAVALPKVSILLMYLRIFPYGWVKVSTKILIFVVLANWFAYLIVSSLQCIPVEFQWDKSIEGGRCFDQVTFYKTVNIPTIVTDVIMLLLPIQPVLGLNASVTRKVALCFIFLAGSVGSVAACMRMAAFFHTNAFTDNTWASVELVGWSVAEPGMYLTAACLMCLRPLLIRLGRKLHLTRFMSKHSVSANSATNHMRTPPSARSKTTTTDVDLDMDMDDDDDDDTYALHERLGSADSRAEIGGGGVAPGTARTVEGKMVGEGRF